VAVLAVDPSSPYSGGAILGDRIRLDDYSLDPGVFVRSMANRGHLGGLSLAAPEAVRLLSVLGFDLVLVETVGVGQAELAITSAVDTTLVVVTPGWGDDVQAAKAGILEIADVFVINKADRDGFEVTRADLEYMVNRTHPEVDAWVPPIIETVATKGIGLNQLQAAISAHRSWLEARDLLVRRRLDRLWSEVEVVVSARFEDLVRNAMIREVATDIKIQLSVGAIDPCAAADEMVRAVCDSVLRLQLDPRPTPKRGA
jgi:LAO/AO transport system kinase